MEWVQKTSKLDKMLKQLSTLCTHSVDVGVFDKYYDQTNDNLSVAQVMQWQEEGTYNIPERKMFRVYLHKELSGGSYKTPLRDILLGVANSNLAPTKALKSVGEGLEVSLKAIIDAGIPPANSPTWANQKGGLSPLTHTGVMQESVSYRLSKKAKGT